MTKVSKFLALGVGGVMLTGCQVGPKYVKPTVPSPPAYKTPLVVDATDSTEWKPAAPNDQAHRGEWWVIFDDQTLNDLENQLRASNQGLKLEESRLRQARAAVGLSQASEFPNIGLSPSIGNERASANQPYFNRSLANNGVGNFVFPFDFSYEIDLWGRVRRSVSATKEEAQATAGDVEVAKLSLEAEMARDYFEVRSADLQKALLTQTVCAYERALRLTEARYRGGAAPRAEVDQAKAQLESARVQETDVDQTRSLFENAVAVLAGRSPSEFLIPREENYKFGKPAIPVGIPSTLLERRPDVAAAERRVAEANDQIGIAKAAYFPQVTIGASAGFQSTQASNWFNWPSRLWAVGPSISQPLFDGGRRRAVTESARANYDGAVAVYRQNSLTAFAEVEDGLSALRVLREEIVRQRNATDASERSLDLFEKRYKNGADTYLQVVAAQTAALLSERNEIDLRRRQVEAAVLLVKAIGGGWEVSQLPSY